jgi:hypothetical protein
MDLASAIKASAAAKRAKAVAEEESVPANKPATKPADQHPSISDAASASTPVAASAQPKVKPTSDTAALETTAAQASPVSGQLSTTSSPLLRRPVAVATTAETEEKVIAPSTSTSKPVTKPSAVPLPKPQADLDWSESESEEALPKRPAAALLLSTLGAPRSVGAAPTDAEMLGVDKAPVASSAFAPVATSAASQPVRVRNVELPTEVTLPGGRTLKLRAVTAPTAEFATKADLASLKLEILDAIADLRRDLLAAVKK